MKAVVIRNQGKGVEAWKLVERPEPKPGPGQVLLRVRAASLNYRDYMIAKGVYAGPLGQDIVPLADGAGEIVALGEGVHQWKVGDRVASTYFQTWQDGPMRPEYFDHQLGAKSNDGVLAEYAVLSENGVVRIPDYLSFEEAATLPCAALTAYTAIFESAEHFRPGGSILVQGTGGVSLFAAQLARAHGLRVLATTSSAAKAARLKELGAEVVVNYRDVPEWQTEILRATNGEGVDQVLEVGGGGTLKRSFEAVKFGGLVSVIGLLTGVGPEVDPLPILFKALHVEGVIVGSRHAFQRMNRALERFQIHPIVDEVFPLSRASDALAKLERGAHFGKIVIRVDS
ncbi:MAG: NAD(P)-dependent alcohol dehydrogenase [Polyangiaceae bacterium]|nr:NAD(P)-dependent alcohol dehydrogenase [Polyangiaceae bacterium]